VDFVTATLGAKRPAAVRELTLPRRAHYHPSPGDWRDEVIYFLLPNRFSDGQEASRPLLDTANLATFRPASFRWNRWAGWSG
jgi:hypothetical protein